MNIVIYNAAKKRINRFMKNSMSKE